MTTIRPIPVDRYLVPDQAPLALPADATRVRQTLERGLPVMFRLDSELTLAVFVPTGDAILWRDAAADAVVLDAADELAPRAPDGHEDPVARPAARLVLRRSNANVASVALRVGLHTRLPDDGASGALVELWIIDYDLRAGTFRGPGDFGSFIELAWRRVDRGTDTYAQPPLDPRVAERFAGQMESEVGGDS